MFYNIGGIIMKEFVARLFSEHNSSLKIGLFDRWHFLYLLIFLGGTILISLLYKSKTEKSKERVIRLFTYLTIGIYISDFFLMPLSDSYGYSIGINDLPFHLCTIIATLAPFVQFNKRFSKIKSAIVTLAVASSLMWMCYPGSALGGQPPFSYIILSKFAFHGFLFAWGVLNLSLGCVRLEFKSIWKELCVILCILGWAKLGNLIYGSEQNWFFIEYSIFPFLSDRVMPLMVVLCVFGTCLVVYGGYYVIRAIAHRQHKPSYKFKHV